MASLSGYYQDMDPAHLEPLAEVKKRQKPRRAKLTKTVVEAIPLPIPGKREHLWDIELPGFGVMVMPSGVRSYLIQYTIGGRKGTPARYTIGHHGKPWTTEKARGHAREKLMMVKSGIDPNHDKKRRHEATETERRIAEELNFNTLADAYLSAKHKLRTVGEMRSIFDRRLRPRFGRLPVTAISKDHVHAMNDDIGDSSESAANKAFSKLKAFLNWVSDRKSGLYPHSPIHRMKLPYAEGKRTRFLTGAEIRYLWLASGELPEPHRSHVRLLLLLGQRLREVAQAHHNEFDFKTGKWIIPPERTKNKRPHLLPLSRQAMDILRAIAPTAAHRRGFVLTLNGKTPINGFSKTKELLDAALVRVIHKEYERHGHKLAQPMTIADWVYHDLRRTLATNLQAKLVPLVSTEAILNHALPNASGVGGTYHLYEYFTEKESSLAMWGEMVDAIVANADDFEVPLVPYDGDALHDSMELLTQPKAALAAPGSQIELF